MIKRLTVILFLFLVSINIALADPAVDSFKAKAIIGGIVELSWTVSDPADSLDRLELYRGSELIKEFKIEGGKISDLYNDASVAPGSTYDYKLIVYNTNANTVESQMQVTIDNTPPKLATPKEMITNQKTLTVETDENTLCKGGVKGTNLTLLEGKEKTHPLPIEFVEGQNIVSVVCADESANEFAAPEDITVIYDSTKPSKPNLNLKFEAGTAKLSWDAATDGNGVKGYHIYKSDSQDGVFQSSPVDVSQLTFEEAVQTTTYYAVGAVDNAGNEERSDVTAVEISSAPAPAIQSAAVADTQTAGAKKSRIGLFLWIGFLAAVILGLATYHRKKNDKFGLTAYLHRRSKMR